MRRPGQNSAALLQEVLKRHPQAVIGAEQHDMGKAGSTILANWLKTMMPAGRELHVSLGRGDIWSTGKDIDTEFLSIDFMSDYTLRVHLEPLCQEMEQHVPGLATQLLNTLTYVNWRVVDIMTPQALLEWGANDLWYGATTDKEYLEALQEFGEGDEDFDGRYRPSKYIESLGEFYKQVEHFLPNGTYRKPKLWSIKKTKLAVQNAPSWMADVALRLPKLRALFDKIEGVHDIVSSMGFEEHPRWRLEPSLVFWWNRNDDMGYVYDEVLQYRYQCTDDYIDEILRVKLTSADDATRMVGWIEKAVPFISALEDLRLLLWENQHEDER